MYLLEILFVFDIVDFVMGGLDDLLVWVKVLWCWIVFDLGLIMLFVWICDSIEFV